MTTKKNTKADAASAPFINADAVNLFGNYDDFTSFNKANVDALVQSSLAVAKAIQTVSKAWTLYAQKTAQQSMAMAKALSTVTTLREAAELQTDFAKNSFDGLLVEGQKLSELSVEAANQAIEPLKARFAEVETFMKNQAA